VNSNKEPVKTVGVAKELPKNPKYFTEISIPEVVKIPVQKPDIEQLAQVIVEAEIMSMRVVDTPCTKSFEGQMLSGKKLILELKLIEKIVYVADEPSQPVHAAHYEEVMRSAFVIVPKAVDGISIETLLKAGKVRVTPYIEDIYAEQKDKRTVFKNITLLIDVIVTCEN
jgi:ferredoxin-fold anticodon binding domain-containing protein